MAGWLGEWLKDIVLIVLIAAFIDLLIPNSTLQRYVKVVVSLMITLTILQPVISILQSDEAVQQAAEAALGEKRSSFPELSAILSKGGQLQLDTESRSAEWAAAQLEAMIQQRLAEQLAVKAESVSVEISQDKDTGIAEVSGIRVILTTQGGGLSDGSTSEIHESAVEGQAGHYAHVKRVDSVEVNVRVDNGKEKLSEDEEGGKVGNAPHDPLDTETVRQIKNHLREWLGVSEQVVEVSLSDAPMGSND